MISRIINYIFKKTGIKYKITRQKEQADLFKYVACDKSVIFDCFNISVRNPEDRPYLFVGKDSMIQGMFVFEKNTGTIKIGERTFIGTSSFICIDSIEIGNDVMFSWGCTIVDNNAHSMISSDRRYDVRDWIKGIAEDKIGKYKNWEKCSAYWNCCQRQGLDWF